MSCSRRCGKAPDQSAGGEQGLLRREAKGGGSSDTKNEGDTRLATSLRALR